MAEGHLIFNGIVYAAVVGYILYINFASFYNRTTKALDALSTLFSNWIFRLCYLVVVGFFALDLFPYGGFTLAVLLTIAFLNTNMLVHKNKLNESFASFNEYYQNSAQEQEAEAEAANNQSVSGYVTENNGAPLSENNEAVMNDSNAPVGTVDTNNILGLMDSAEPFVGSENEDSQLNCGPYAPVYTKPFNPRPFRPDESALASGAPDQLPTDSRYNGPYTDSGVAYDYNMA
jgi:hypothetical protein